MHIEDMEASTFEGLEGSTYDVYREDGSFAFKMKLVEVRLDKPHEKPTKWQSVFNYRRQPFSLFFESDRKELVRKNSFTDGGVFERSPVKIEPVDETPSGHIYQMCFN